MTGLPDTVPVDQLEDLILCSICLETLNDPCTLHCFHSFCKVCLEKFVKSQRDKAAAEGKEINEFNCPSCRVVFGLKSNEKVEAISCSHFIKNMIDIVAIQREAKVAKCSRCDAPSSCRCVTCEIFMCEACLSIHESFNLSNHAVLTKSELIQPEHQSKIKGQLHCSEHENKKLKFFCETCEELICRYCMDFNHLRPDHVCWPIEKVAAKHREALKPCLEFLSKKLAEGGRALEDISTATRTLMENAEVAKEAVIRHKEKVKKAFLENLEEEFLYKINEIDEICKERCERLTIQKVKVQSFTSKVKGLVSLSKNLLENGNNEEIIASQKMVEERVENVKRENPKRMKPVHNGNVQYIDTTNTLCVLGKVVCQPAMNPSTVSLLPDASVILKDKNDYVNQMEEWLDGQELKWHLCYRASRDGWTAKDFHRNCDNKRPTVTLVKVDEFIFGGFTDQSWEGNGYKTSSSSFMFSLRNSANLPPFRASIVMVDRAIFADSTRGPMFGNSFGKSPDLCIFSNALVRGESYSEFPNAYKPPDGYEKRFKYILLAGRWQFKPDEVEVFF